MLIQYGVHLHWLLSHVLSILDISCVLQNFRWVLPYAIHSIKFPLCKSSSHSKSLWFHFAGQLSTRLDVDPKRRYATHCTLYSIFPCTPIFILQVYFSTRLDVNPKRRCVTHCTLYSIAACILIDFPTCQSVEFENKRRDPWVTIPFDYVVFVLFWGLGGCRSHGEGGTLKEKIRSKKRSPISRFLES